MGRQHVLSAWSGLRPLAADPSRANTENLVRDHLVTVEAGMVTIAGGKWTTYRKVRESCACSQPVVHCVAQRRSYARLHALPDELRITDPFRSCADG